MRILLIALSTLLLAGCTTSGGIWQAICPPPASCGSHCTLLECL